MIGVELFYILDKAFKPKLVLAFTGTLIFCEYVCTLLSSLILYVWIDYICLGVKPTAMLDP